MKLLLILTYHVFNPEVLIKTTNPYNTTVVQYCNTPDGDLMHHDHDHHTLSSWLLLDWKHTGTLWFIAAKLLYVIKYKTLHYKTHHWLQNYTQSTQKANCLKHNATNFNIQSSEVMYFASRTVFISQRSISYV